MTAGTVTDLGQGRLLIDLGFRDREGLIASYLIPGPDGWTLVETGPGSCRGALEAGVRAAGIQPEEVRRVIVTHIHLDHAGGLGLAAESFPRATLFAHAEGVEHLIDPTRLIASARRAWGAAADPLWGPIPPVPSDRLVPLRGGETFPVQGGTLSILATPGHARHHLSIFDEAGSGLFVGDSAGIRLAGQAVARPAVPPPDLDVERLLESLDRMEERRPRRLLYAHYGAFDHASEGLRQYAAEVRAWEAAAFDAAREDPSNAHVAAALRRLGSERKGPASGSVPPEDAGELVSGYEMAASGFLRYFRRRGTLAE